MIVTPTTGSTALTIATEGYNVQAGDIVLVHTVAGSVGLAFTQLVKARGGTVIGTTSTPEKAAIARAHGADHVILYKQEDTVQRVLELTNGEGVHAIFDGVGKDTCVLLAHVGCKTVMPVMLMCGAPPLQV